MSTWETQFQTITRKWHLGVEPGIVHVEFTIYCVLVNKNKVSILQLIEVIKCRYEINEYKI